MWLIHSMFTVIPNTVHILSYIMSVKTQLSPVDHELRQLKAFVHELFPKPDSLTFVVPEAVQQQESRTMRQGLRSEQFFMVVDFVNLKITEAAGLEEIGYDSARFTTFRQYLSIFPSQGMLQLITLVGKQAFALSHQSVLSFMKPNYVAQVPITCADGSVMLAKRMASPWQYTDTGKMTSYVVEYTVMKPYENEPMNPRFLNLDPAIETEFNNVSAKLFANMPARANLFSPKEIVLMKLYVAEEHQGLSAKQLAVLAGVAHNTINTHNKTIMQKAKTMFGESILAKTARDVAVFLKKSGLLK